MNPRFPPDALKSLRRRLGLSRTGLAAKLGVSAAAVRGWECGRQAPRGRAREALAELLSAAVENPA